MKIKSCLHKTTGKSIFDRIVCIACIHALICIAITAETLRFLRLCQRQKVPALMHFSRARCPHKWHNRCESFALARCHEKIKSNYDSLFALAHGWNGSVYSIGGRVSIWQWAWVNETDYITSKVSTKSYNKKSGVTGSLLFALFDRYLQCSWWETH